MTDTRFPYPRRRSLTNWQRPWRYSWLAWPLLGAILKSEIKVLGIMVKYIDIPACSLLYSARDKLRTGDSGSEPSGGKSRGKVATVDEIIEAALFLASDTSS